jgi:5-methylcytosine-specific restriction protein A
MTLDDTLSRVLIEYDNSTHDDFADHPLAKFIRHEAPSIIRAIIGKNDRYIVEGSAGHGNWARIPWIAVFDRFITESAQQGYYVVYLFKEDLSGVYISLNQGVTFIKKKYGADAKTSLRARAHDLIAQLGKPIIGWKSGPIDLANSIPGNLGAYYEQGAIYSKYYPQTSLSANTILERDLADSLDMYLMLATKETIRTGHPEEDEDGLQYESLITLREHKRIDRNQTLARKAKKIHGFTCQVCEMNFEDTYGELGINYIEAQIATE